MALSFGQAAAAAITTNSTAVTSGVTTQSGSDFVVGVIYQDGSSSVSVTDSKGNSYSEIDAAAGPATFNGVTMRMKAFLAVNGTGGAGHTFTATCTTPDGFPTILVEEVRGAHTSAPLDDRDKTDSDNASPFQSAAIDTTVADTALISFIATDSSAATTNCTPGNSFTKHAEVADGTQFWPGAVAGRIVAATGNYQDSWTEANSNVAIVRLIALKIAAAGGAVKRNNLMLAGMGR